uniref:tape measure protein n=1 Tax=uncultured Corynebacterium sp. TaxID=159447 RepID=UPI0025F53A3D
MAITPGYAVLPISASLLGVTDELRKQLVGPTQKASKQAGDAIRKSMTDGVDQAAKNTEKAQYRVLKSTQELETAESKLTEQKLKTEAANKAVEAAARVRAESESKGVAAVEKAEEALLRKRAAAEREARNLIKAEEGVEKALTESARAAESLEKRQGELDAANKDAEKSSRGFIASLQDMGTELDETAEKSAGFGDKLMSGLGKVGTGALLGVGAKIGSTVVGSIGTAFEKGFGRLQSIEQAETMLGGLGNSAEGIAEIMDNAMDSVSGTAYGFGEAASMAATFAGAGIEQGEELTRILSLVGDSAAITGADFQEMGSIWTKMASSGRLSTDEMNQMMDRGLGLLPELQKHYNVTADEARKMVSDGKVSFEDFSEIMENMVGGSSQAMGETFSGSAANMQAALGRLGAKFLDPIYANAPAVFQAIGGAVDKLGEHLSPLIADFSEKLAPYMEDFAERLGPALEKSIDNIANGFKVSVEWIRENSEWLKALAVSVGTAVTAWKLWTLGMKAHNTAVLIGEKGWKAYIASTKIATAVTKLFNKATKANVIGLIVTAVAALAAGLVYFFTKTETGREMWEKFTTALGEGWDWVTEKLSAGFEWISGAWDSLTGAFSAGWENYIKPVWDGLVTAGKYAAAILGTLVLTPIMVAWNLLSDAFKVGWETVIKPVWDALSAAATWLWETILQPVFTSIGDGWQWLSDRFTSVWELIKTGVFDAWNWYIDRVKANWELVAGALNAAWTLVKDTFLPIWDTIRTAVFDAWNAYADRVKANWDVVTTALGAAWNAVRDVLGAGWDWIRDNVFSKFNTAIDLMRSGAEIAMDGIGKAFDWLREKTAKPVNFVIEYVYGGIREAWGAVAGLVGLDELPKIEKIGGFAEGTARVPGARTRHDNMHMRSMDGRFGISLRGGEGVVVPEVVDALGEGTINNLNRVALQRGVGGVHHYLEHLGGFSQGGIIDSMMGFVNKHFPGLSMTSGWRFTDTGMHSRGQAADFSNQVQGGPSTPESRALARAIYTNFPRQTEQLIHWQEDGWRNLLSGQPFNYGEPTNSQHTDHVHWGLLNPLNYDADELDLSGGGGGIFESITNMAKRLWDGVIDKIPGFPGADSLGKFGQLPAAFLKKAASSAWDYIKGLADKLMSFGGSSGGGAEQWRGLASQALKRMGYGDEYLDAMLQQIQIESTGDPNAVNNWDSNAARGTPSRGLLQVIDPTYRDVRNRYPSAFEGLPDDSTHPLTNLVAGVGAVKRDWGGPGGRWPTKDGYHAGGLAGVGQGWLRKTAIEPEMVLDPQMTQAFIQWMDVAQDVARAVGPDAASAGRGYLESQATSVLDVFGLGGLVPLGSG